LNGGLNAVFIGKPSERMSNFWTVWFLKTDSKQNFRFPHITTTWHIDQNVESGSWSNRQTDSEKPYQILAVK